MRGLYITAGAAGFMQPVWPVRGHDYTIGTLDVLQACDACADIGMTYSVIVQCADCGLSGAWYILAD